MAYQDKIHDLVYFRTTDLISLSFSSSASINQRAHRPKSGRKRAALVFDKVSITQVVLRVLLCTRSSSWNTRSNSSRDLGHRWYSAPRARPFCWVSARERTPPKGAVCDQIAVPEAQVSKNTLKAYGQHTKILNMFGMSPEHRINFHQFPYTIEDNEKHFLRKLGNAGQQTNYSVLPQAAITVF